MLEPNAFIVRANIHIVGIQPPVVRTLELPLDLNLAQLHEVLQATFGWTDSHLHKFDIGGLTYGAPEFDPDGWSDCQIFEASSVRLADFNIPYDAPILVFYEYDFGDSWEHVLELTRARPASNTRAASPVPALHRPRTSVAPQAMETSSTPGVTRRTKSTWQCADGPDASSTPSASISATTTKLLPAPFAGQRAPTASVTRLDDPTPWLSSIGHHICRCTAKAQFAVMFGERFIRAMAA